MATRYQILMLSPGPQNPVTHMVKDARTGRYLGGYGANFYRNWVFPLYTPGGLTVIQEFAYDHPFHNGLFVGQSPVKCDGRVANLWVAPPRRSHNDPVYANVGRMDAQGQPACEAYDGGVRFTLKSVWLDENEQPVLDELRTVTFCADDGATICEMSSAKSAVYGALEFPQTKFGSIGIRVEPRLLPPLGAVVLADGGRRGSAALVDQQRDSDFVAYENDAPGGGRFGVFMTIRDPGVRGPWFIRDYGMAMYNPTWDKGVTVTAGETWTVSLRVVAYEGALTEARVHQWRQE
jgi:hypothetical protein